MDSSCNSSIDSAPQRENSCDSHVSIYYEQNQNQQEEELTEDQAICSCSSEEKILQNPPVEIHEENTTSIDLPPLTWHGYNNCPKILTVTNTGRTILINGHWAHSRPYIEGGPLNGTYLFSQIHFHCPSEHEIDGQRYPLEMHIVHYKTSYLTQERAMNEKDGTIVLVYLFKLMNTSTVPTVVSQITKLAPQLTKVNSRTECTDIDLDQLIKPFISNYYVYWGSVTTKKSCHLLQWIISCSLLSVTQQEVDDLSNIITCAVGPIVKQTPRVKPENDAIYHVGEEDYSLPALKTLSADDVCNICRCHEVPYVSCQCRWKKVDPAEAVDGEDDVLVCSCRSKVYICKSNCNIHKGRRFCSKCKSIEVTCCREGQEGKCSVHLQPQRVTRRRQSRARRNSKLCCELEMDGPDGIPVLNCESANGSSISSLFDEMLSKTKKKCKRKKKIFGRMSKNSSDDESENSKSSACDDNSKVKSEKTAEKSESEGVSNCELKKIIKLEERPKKEKTCDSPGLQQGSDREDDKGNSKCDTKAKNRIKDLTVVESVFSVKEILSKQPSKTSTELCYPSPNSSGCRVPSPKPTVYDDGTEEKTGEDPQSPEVKISPDCEPREQPSNACSTDEDKKKTKLSEDIVLKSPKYSRCLQSRSKSRANVNKLKDASSSEREPALKPATRPSKSKSPARDFLPKRKVSIRKQSESSEYPNSKSKVSMPESSQSKTGKNKKIVDYNLSQSEQEVKCPVKKSSARIANLTRDSKSPGDIRIRGSKLYSKKSSKLVVSKSKEEGKGKNIANNGGRRSKHDYNITTLFEKKQNDRKIQSLSGDTKDVQINFLLTPNIESKSTRSCVLTTTSESDFLEEKKALEDISRSNFAQDFTVNRTIISESEFPLNKPKKGSQVCLLMEHILQFESNAKVCRCSSQEYHVAIMYDQNIMQEYRGKFHPQELQIGNYEMLNLVPIYPEPENASFRLQDCEVKKDADQICIRVKFLMKELNVRDIYANTENELHEPSETKKKILLDEETQYSRREFDLDESHVSKYPMENQNVKKNVDHWSTEILNSESQSKSAERQKEQPKNRAFPLEKEVLEPLKCTIKLRSDPDVFSQDASQSSGELRDESNSRENRMETTYSEQSDKKLKPLFVKRRKTVYFIYDKVEKDLNTGKKVFVGSFKTKEEVDDMKKQKKILQENEVASANEKFEKTSEARYLLSFGNKQANLEVLKLEESPTLKKHSPDKKSPAASEDAFSNQKKDVVTLHKYRPKFSDINRFKKKCKNVLIGKVVDNVHRESNSSKNLAEILSLEKKDEHKISIYEVHEASDSGSQKKPDPDSSKGGRRTTAMNVALTKIHVNSKTDVTVTEKPNKTVEDSVRDNSHKSLDKKESQAALILTPVEVESLSKIEVILIEHLDNLKRDKKEA